jgi:hypothetical protein
MKVLINAYIVLFLLLLFSCTPNGTTQNQEGNSYLSLPDSTKLSDKTIKVFNKVKNSLDIDSSETVLWRDTIYEHEDSIIWIQIGEDLPERFVPRINVYYYIQNDSIAFDE